jgi:hypothetical protein
MLISQKALTTTRDDSAEDQQRWRVIETIEKSDRFVTRSRANALTS